MYDKLGIILRIETTTNDVSSCLHYRKVEHRKAPASMGFAPCKKNIYSLSDLTGILFACNRRYLAHLSALEDFSDGIRLLDRVTRPRKINGKTIKGSDFFDPTQRTLLRALQNPRFNIAGIRRADFVPLLSKLSPSALSRHIRRLRHLGLIKRVAQTYRYYLTRAGRAVIAAARSPDASVQSFQS
jgi:DNA-binding transcriptional ArsR family regulator